MSDWKNYINTILKDKNVEDAAIVGHADNKSVWASKPGGVLAAISPQEVSLLVGQDRKAFLQTGITIGGKKCSVIRDNLMVNNDGVMDVRMKGGQGKSICIGKTIKTMVFVMGKKGVHGGALNKKVHEVANYLKQRGI
ncbi:profilin-3-like [Cetorhinus maximus]